MKKKLIYILVAAACILRAAGCTAPKAMPEGTENPVHYSEEKNTGVRDLDSMTAQEKEIQVSYDREQMKESLAYLEKFGVSYDTEKNRIFYDGKQVRWLIDDRPDDSYTSCHLSGGGIDIYTKRDQKGRLTGIKTASEEEFEERTKAEEKKDEAFQVTQTTVEEASSGSSPSEKSPEEKRIETEYKNAGIEKNDRGMWTWKGKEIRMLMDENGGMMQNGSDKAAEENIYIYITRGDKGQITKAEQVTGKELLQKKAQE